MEKEQQQDYDWEDRWIDTYLIGRGIYRVETRAGQSAGDVCTDAQSKQRDGPTVRREAAVSRDLK